MTVLGGRAENVLLFPATVPSTGNFSTQWTISFVSGGYLRFTWTGGADPGIGDVQPQQYVNIFGGGFTSSSNVGTFPIIAAQGGAVGIAYFEVNNPTGSPGIVVQGTDTAILFYNPIRETILSKSYYAAIYQTQHNILQIFMPATTQVIKRSRIGSAHLHGVTEQPVAQFILPPASEFPSTGPAAYFIMNDLGTSYEFYVWFNVTGGSNTNPSIPGFTGIEVTVNSSDSADTVAAKTSAAIHMVYPVLVLTIVNNILTMANTTVSTAADAGPSLPTTLGPYIFDTQQGFVVGGASTLLTEDLNGNSSKVITVSSSAGFPNTNGYLVINYGCEDQEGPIPYIATPSSGTILISPAYFIQQDHPAGSSVLLITQKSPVTLPTDGSFYEPYLTDTASGRVYAQNLINTITAAGVTVIYTILYPNPIGLGGWESITPSANEISYVYGP